jgi:hypothetical protein
VENFLLERGAMLAQIGATVQKHSKLMEGWSYRKLRIAVGSSEYTSNTV